MSETLFEILFECDDLLLINKAPGLVCHPSKNGPLSSLVGRIRLHFGTDGEAHLINRLDRETSGIVLVAKNRDAARFLRRLWERRLVEKTYHAIIHGHPDEDSFVVSAPLGRDEASVVAVKDCVRDDGAVAETAVRVEERFFSDQEPFSWVEVKPRTGRKHQIRIHLAYRGYPLVGDKLYGVVENAYLDLCEGRLSSLQRQELRLDCHALHASRLVLPLDGAKVSIVAPVPLTLREFGSHSGSQFPFLPSQIDVGTDLEDRLIASLCAEMDQRNNQKRSSCSGVRRKC